MTNPLPMTPVRWVALVIGTPLALLVIGWTALTAVAFAGLGSARVNLATPLHGRTAVVSVDEGDITVGPGPADQLRVRGTLHYSLVRPRLRWQRTPSKIALHAHCRVPTGVCSFDYTVTVPPMARSEISTASGNLRATRISGNATISDDAGDIIVTSLAGTRALISSDAGDITGRAVSSQILTVQDQAGDIRVVFTKVPRRVVVSDSVGDITLVLPP